VEAFAREVIGEISKGATYEMIEHMSAAVKTKCWAERVIALQVHRFTPQDRQELCRFSIYDLPVTVLWRITSSH